ncbi:transcription elongation factor A protein 2-like protein, partial [Leptotrombidium deliense]
KLKEDAVPEDIDVDCDDIAADIENAIYSEFKDTNMKNKNRVCSLPSNLKDTKNSHLRYHVTKRNIDAKRIAVMSADVSVSHTTLNFTSSLVWFAPLLIERED